MTTLLPTGEQLTISHGAWSATITEVGATLRTLTVNGRNAVFPFSEDSVPFSCQGQQLMPWPNRIRDGRYTWDGTDQQLPINEIDRNTALHGLVFNVPWRTVEHTDAKLVQSVVVYEQPGWPGVVECTVTHELGADGLTVTVGATNRGADAIPFGYAAHPYLSTGEQQIDDVEITLPASQYLVVDAERLLPIEIADVTGTPYDLRGGKPLGDVVLDTAFTGLPDGWEVVLRHGDAETVMWGDQTMTWIQVHTSGGRDMLAVEPMTCGPDTFNEGPTHADLITLEPGASWTGAWGIRGK